VSVCEAVEHFGEEVLGRRGLWLKIAGGNKADVLGVATRKAPSNGGVVEIEAYCGYSALRLAMARPGVHITTLEVDPVHVVIAWNVTAFAGLAHVIDVWTGHAGDLIPKLAGYPAFRAVFMDYRGSRFHEDLATLEHLELLQEGVSC
jgi:predicted O-methyltransferase YrrM